MALVQFTMAYQSFHAFSHTHYAVQHTQNELKKESKHTVAQQHVHDDESCSVCDFHFDFFVAPQQFCLTLNFDFTPIPYSYSSTENNAFFAGSLFALRAPPALV